MFEVTGPVFCDALRVSVPQCDSQTVMDELSPYLDHIGAHIDFQGSYRKGTGLLSCRASHGVSVISASGQILAELRALKLLDSFLMGFNSVPHKVTRLDATADVPLYGPDAIKAVYQQGHKGEVVLSRKAVSRRHVAQQLGPVAYEDPSPRVTGSVYLGGPQAEVRAVVYDKRQELLQKQGLDIGEDRVRFECRVKSGMSPSLRDASNPAPIFFHFMSPSLVKPSADVPAWVPAGGSFHVDRRDVLPYERLKSIIEGSPDFRRVASIVSDLGSPGRDMAMRLIMRGWPAITPHMLRDDGGVPGAG